MGAIRISNWRCGRGENDVEPVATTGFEQTEPVCYMCGSSNHIQSTCLVQWHPATPCVTDNEGDPEDHLDEFTQEEYPPAAWIEWEDSPLEREEYPDNMVRYYNASH